MPQAIRKSIPVGVRVARIMSDSVNEESREVDVVWTTGAIVRRFDWYDGDYNEELSLDEGACDLTRFNSGAPVLDSHNSYELESVLGSIVDGTALIANGEGRARVRFVTGDVDVDAIWNKVKQKAVRSVSVGYIIHEIQEIRQDGQIPTMRATKWEPIELSFVACPADAGAGVRAQRSAPCSIITAENHAEEASTMATKPKEVAPVVAEETIIETVVDPVVVDAAAVAADTRKAILSVTRSCALAGLSARATSDIVEKSDGKSDDEIHALVMAARDAAIASGDQVEISGHRSADNEKPKRLVDNMRARHVSKGVH